MDPSNSILDKNLEALGRIDPSLSTWVTQAQDSPLVEATLNPSGLQNLKVQTSAGPVTLYHPDDQAHSLTDFRPHDDYAAGDQTIILGFGLGHEAAGILARADKNHQVWVIEADALITRHALSSHDFSMAIARGQLQIIPPHPDHITAHLEARVKRLVLGRTMVHVRENQRAISGVYDQLFHHFFKAFARLTASAHLLDTTGRITIENFLKNAPLLAAGPRPGRVQGLTAGAPAVVVAAGPSLKSALPHLAGLRDRAVIIAAVQVLGDLLAHGIRPDLAVALDHTETLMDVGQGLWGIADVPLLVRPGIYPGFLVKYGGPRIMLPDERAFWDEGEKPPPWLAKTNVASLAFAAARYLGADPVILVGVDLIISPSEAARLQEDTDGAADVVSVPGQDGRLKPTLPAYLHGLVDIEAVIAATEGRVYNASIGGARISGAPELPIEEVSGVLGGGRVDRSALNRLGRLPDLERIGVVGGALTEMGKRLDKWAEEAEVQVSGIKAFKMAPTLSESLYQKAETMTAEVLTGCQGRPLLLYWFHSILRELSEDDFRLEFEDLDNRGLRLAKADIIERFLGRFCNQAAQLRTKVEAASGEVGRLAELMGRFEGGTDDAAGWLDLAAGLRQMGFGAVAVDCLKRAVETDPADEAARAALEDALSRRAPAEGVVVVDAAPGSPDEAMNRAEALIGARRFEQALDIFRSHAEAYSGDMRPPRGVLICLRALGEMEELEAFAGAMRERFPDEALFDCELGDILLARGEVEEAARMIDQGVAKDGRFGVFWAKVAAAFMGLGHAARAGEYLQKQIEFDPGAADAYFNLAQCRAATGDVKGAMEALDRCLELRPGFEPAEELLLRLHNA